ncbi:hypothetical protein PAHAL_9G527000 [Panicum hallii]|uniref:Uncharacterized protein n=1 Tax=Panicum hallii TaxID=206008 RepID=A0A2S3ISP1_9POAL|nr:hypothetical protein PAHAL_9G527000 [Panicum hallii]
MFCLISNPRSIFFSSDAEDIRLLQRQGPEGREDLPASMCAASPIRHPPSVDGTLQVDIGPPIASRFRGEAEQQLIKMNLNHLTRCKKCKRW